MVLVLVLVLDFSVFLLPAGVPAQPIVLVKRPDNLVRHRGSHVPPEWELMAQGSVVHASEYRDPTMRRDGQKSHALALALPCNPLFRDYAQR